MGTSSKPQSGLSLRSLHPDSPNPITSPCSPAQWGEQCPAPPSRARSLRGDLDARGDVPTPRQSEDKAVSGRSPTATSQSPAPRGAAGAWLGAEEAMRGQPSAAVTAAAPPAQGRPRRPGQGPRCSPRPAPLPTRGRAAPAPHGQIRADSRDFPAPVCFYFPFSALLLVNWRCCCLPFES